MITRHFARFGFAIVFPALVLAAQSVPDFSGVWKPSSFDPPPAPAQPGGPPPPPRTVSTTISQSRDEMKLLRRVESGGRELEYTFIYKLDGSESVNQMASIVFHTRAAWDTDKLVLTSLLSVDDKRLGELREVYRLEKGDLVVETTRTTPAGTFTGRTTHKKG